MRRPKVMIHEPCDPGCPGWFVSGDTGKVERCDECDLFEDDADALAHVVDAAESLARIERALRAAQAKRPPKTAVADVVLSAWPGGARFEVTRGKTFAGACARTLLDSLQHFAEGLDPATTRDRGAERELLARFLDTLSGVHATIVPKGAAQKAAANRLAHAGLLRATTSQRRGRGIVACLPDGGFTLTTSGAYRLKQEIWHAGEP